MTHVKSVLRIKRICFVMMILLPGWLAAYRTDLIFNYLSVKEGLSQGTVFCILKDHKGFMWIGTSDGLNRYDGLSFTIYHNKVDDPQSLSNNFISCLFEDAEGFLWVGTDGGGLNRMETGVAHFQRYRHKADDPDSVVSDSIRSICQDRRGNLWVGTDQGLDCLLAGGERFIHYRPHPDDSGSIAGRSINFVLADREGHIWIGLRDAGVDCYHPDTGRFVHYRHDRNNDRTLASDRVTGACLAPDGMIWICHGSRWISRLDPKTGNVQNYSLGEDAQMISGVCPDSKGNIWVSSANGLYFLNATTGESMNIRSNPRFPATLINNALLSVFVDETDIIWVGTNFFGVNQANINAKRFIKYSHDPTNPNTLGFAFVRGIYENRSGVLYIGGSMGFDRFDRTSGTWRHFFNERGNPISRIQSIVHSICPNSDDERDFLWIGTEGDGLFVFDQVRQTARPYPIPGLRSRLVYALYKDDEGFLWIGTEEGLSRYDQKKKEIRSFDLKRVVGLDAKSTVDLDVYWIMRDRQGILWVGTRSYGLFAFDPRTNQWRNYPQDPENPRSLSHNMVTTILETKKGELWVGTYGGGFNRMDRHAGTFEHFTTSQGLPNDVVYGILEDDFGQLWISTNFGLCRFNPSTGSFRSYTEQDGLTGNEFNTESFHKSRWTGELFFGGTNGLNAFFPREVPDDPHPPSVVIEDLKIFNRSVIPGPDSVLKKPIDDIDSISLSYRDSMLTFEFNGLHYVAPAKNRFAYFLQGFDRQWNQTNAQRRYATYTNLNPGRYTLRIKAANGDGVWNETGKTLKIFISPPFWKTWWFTLLFIVFILLAFFAIYRYRVRGLQKRKTELENLVALRTQELKDMSLSDPMTQLHNRRYVSEVVQDEIDVYVEQRQFVIQKGQRRKTTLPQSVIGIFLIDVDYFKKVNDRYGHKAGDLFLSEFASILRKCVRREDVIVRWGGEEFLLILKNCDPAHLTAIAEKIRKAVEANEFLISDTEEIRVRSSCCIGIIRFPFVEDVPDLISFDHAITLADMAMYLGKENGRNRTVYLEHSGLIPDREEVQKYFYPLEALKGSGFVKIQEFSSEDKEK